MMGESSFELIAQELLRHKGIMEQLEQENRQLRRQLADLRAGYGFSIEIDGQRFSLPIEAIASTQAPTTAPAPSPTHEPVETQFPVQPTMEASQQPVMVQEQPSRQTKQLVMDDSEIQPTAHLPLQLQEETVQEEQEATPVNSTFLEEVMIDEFMAATTSSHSVWSAPEQEQSPATDEDEELALLRRQLIGSYLLE